MFKNLQKKLNGTPPRPLVIFTWVWIFSAFFLAIVLLVAANKQIQPEFKALGKADTPPSPRIFSVIIPGESSPGSEVIIRGGKFGSRGQVCFQLSSETIEVPDCPHPFEVLVWTSGSIRAKIPEVEKGEGKLWMVMGEGIRSNEVDFLIE